jgi:hypothetical protein
MLSRTSDKSLSGTPIAGALLGVEYHWIRPILFAGVSDHYLNSCPLWLTFCIDYCRYGHLPVFHRPPNSGEAEAYTVDMIMTQNYVYIDF